MPDSDYKPMLVLFSSFDALLSLLEENKNEKIVDGDRIDTSTMSIDSMIAPGGSLEKISDGWLASLKKSKEVQNDKSLSSDSIAKPVPKMHRQTKSLMDKIALLISADLYNYGIFLAIHISDASYCSYFKKKFNSSKILSLIYLFKNSKEYMHEHAEQLTKCAEAAYRTLCSAMEEKNTFSAMRDNDGYIDISGVYDYCFRLQLELDGIEKKLDALQKASAELNSSWNDQVYDYFNNGIVNTELPERLSHSLRRIKLMKSDLEKMCEILDKYYNAEVSIDYGEIYFSYNYIGIEKEVYQQFSSTFTV